MSNGGIFNPIWTGLFANLKRLRGAILPPPPLNLTISSQKTMKLGNYGQELTKIFDDVIIMLILQCHQNETAKKNSRFSMVLAEYLKNGSTDFHQT